MTTETEVKEERSASRLKILHETHLSLERLRVQLGNRVSALERGVDTAANPIPEEFETLFKYSAQMEAVIEDSIERELKNYPVWDAWLKHVKGVGPGLAGQMLALLLPPRADKGPSSWYKAAGLYVEQRPDGMSRLPRARAGEGKITYHPWLRRCLWNVGTSFVRNGGYYRKVYEQAKERLQAQHQSDKGWPPHRIDSVARWKTIKLFLTALWTQWCKSEGIHDRGPYGLTTLADGTKVLRVTGTDGSIVDHAYIPAPEWDGKTKI